MTHHQAAQKWQLSVKKMCGPRHNRNWQCLGPRPIEYVDQGNRIVHLTMDDQHTFQHVLGQYGNRKTGGCGTDQHDFFDIPHRMQGLNRTAGDECAERESGQGQCPVWRTLSDHGKHIFQLATALVINT